MPTEEITPRERYLKSLCFEPVDRIPITVDGPWAETLERWHSEGLPREVPLHEYFQAEVVPMEYVGVHTQACPPFEERTIEETENYRIFTDLDGATRKEFKEHGQTSMPLWLDYPIKDRTSWEQFKEERFRIDDPARFPTDWQERCERWKTRETVLLADGGSYYGKLRNWIGVERISELLYDDPELVEEMVQHCSDVCATTLTRILMDTDLDYLGFWEDMAFKNGPLISPKRFRELALPCYQRVTKIARERGVKLFILDSDGDIRSLIPIWLDGGINCLLPFEVAAGMDVVEVRKQYGKRLAMSGGMDKRVLASNREAIREEVMSKVPPLLKEGGYLPHVDHGVPPDVSFENYRYYFELVREAILNP